MKINIPYASGFFLILGVFAAAYFLADKSTPSLNKTAIHWSSFSEGVVLAKQSKKKMIVDVYTTWCSWCKKMDSDVYSNSEIAQLINDNFIAVKLNAESNTSVSYKGTNLTESDLARSLSVTAYPTTVFFDHDSDPITNLEGFVASERFAKVLDYIGQNHYRSVSFQDYLAKSK